MGDKIAETYRSAIADLNRQSSLGNCSHSACKVSRRLRGSWQGRIESKSLARYEPLGQQHRTTYTNRLTEPLRLQWSLRCDASAVQARLEVVRRESLRS